MNIRYLSTTMLLLCATILYAQKDYRNHLRTGDKLYTDSLFEQSEIEYRKAIEKEPNASEAIYNLGNSLLFQKKANEAINQYQIALKKEDKKDKLAQINHNLGVIQHSNKDYSKAIEAYKQALRQNPHDHQTRYNLALAMNQLKQQQQQQEENKEQEQQQKEEEKKQQEQQENKEQEQKDNKQEEQEQHQQQQNQQQQEMSKENAEQLLEAATQDEKEVQEKVKKLMQIQGRKLDKDW